MTVSLRLESTGHKHEAFLCSNGGYFALCAWFDSLSKGVYPALLSLSVAGSFSPTDTLVDQLIAAVLDTPPTDPDVLEIANVLGGLLGDGQPNERLTIEL